MKGHAKTTDDDMYLFEYFRYIKKIDPHAKKTIDQLIDYLHSSKCVSDIIYNGGINSPKRILTEEEENRLKKAQTLLTKLNTSPNYRFYDTFVENYFPKDPKLNISLDSFPKTIEKETVFTTYMYPSANGNDYGHKKIVKTENYGQGNFLLDNMRDVDNTFDMLKQNDFNMKQKYFDRNVIKEYKKI